ncbi:hypothetical protein FA13DRAFT_1405701 [Coprinellus micaceus]|uniref:Uncharacterized protein n=1 Tax=Coprinellus micaceus TaxID=71717 RepID=A0A4Y7SPN4_COPMI|nr:hypothetical protein FA13DRAFT_1405701 [Coprinellus micaceus]
MTDHIKEVQRKAKALEPSTAIRNGNIIIIIQDAARCASPPLDLQFKKTVTLPPSLTPSVRLHIVRLLAATYSVYISDSSALPTSYPSSLSFCTRLISVFAVFRLSVSRPVVPP